MRKALVLATLAVLCSSTNAFAGVPDPTRSGCELKGQGTACHFRFRADGGLDCMTLCITLRDAFDTPVANCSTNACINLVSPKLGCPACPNYAPEIGMALCDCDVIPHNAPSCRSGLTAANGVIVFEWCRLGGRGEAEVCVTAHCVGQIEICCFDFHFTSPDLNGSCEDSPNSSTTVIDLGIWASCLSPAAPCQSADYNSDCVVTVIDLGIFAGGLGLGC